MDPKNQNPFRVKLPTALACFVYMLKPRPADEPGKAPKYQICLLWDKKDRPLLKELEQKIEKLAIQKYGPEAPKLLKAKKLKGFLHDGDVEQSERKEFKGKLYINASSDRKPGCVQPTGNGGLEEVLSNDDIYSGCFVKAVINLFTFDKGVNKGVGFGLQNVMVVKKGEKIAGGVSAEDDFKDEAGGMAATGTDDVDPLD